MAEELGYQIPSPVTHHFGELQINLIFGKRHLKSHPERGNSFSTVTIDQIVLIGRFWNCENIAHLGDTLVSVRVGGSFKWGVPDQALVAEYSNAPQVHLLIVGASFNHLWRQVVQGSTHCLTSRQQKKCKGNVYKITMIPESICKGSV